MTDANWLSLHRRKRTLEFFLTVTVYVQLRGGTPRGFFRGAETWLKAVRQVRAGLKKVKK